CCTGGLLFGRHTCTSSYMLCPNTKFLTVSTTDMFEVAVANLFAGLAVGYGIAARTRSPR
ncbi:hypothetical protein, partial [Pseudomonas cannabina]